MDIGSRKAGRASLHQKAADAVFRPRPDNSDVRQRSVGDPGLLTIQDPVRSVADGTGPHRRRIRPEIRFGQPEAADRSSRLQFGQPSGFLFVRSVLEDRVHHERALHGDEAAQAGIAALDLLHDEPVFHIAHAGAAVALEIRAQESELSHFGNQFSWKPAFAETIPNYRRDSFVDKPPGRLPHHEFLLGELRIDQKVIHAAECHESSVVPRLKVLPITSD